MKPHETALRIVDSVGRALRGKRESVELAVVALLARGHVLVEDVPGVGKTTMARALARSLGLSYRRLQFTSDLMPADVLGGSVFHRERGEFIFKRGPVFTQILLADEINRTTPKTQSALLEAMGEGQVSVDGETHQLPDPFLVIATQNPLDFYGTFPLPESQLDRFLVRFSLGHPPREVERQLLAERVHGDPVAALEAAITTDELHAAQAAVDGVRLDEQVLDYLHAIVVATRESALVEVGASTRAALAYVRAARARALVQGREFATPDDVKSLAVPVLAHRLRIGEGDQRDEAGRILRDLLAGIPVPV